MELHAVRKLCEVDEHQLEPTRLMANLKAAWCIAPQQRLQDGRALAALDEAFHQTLVQATGNLEMSGAFARLTDRIRIVRRLDFIYGDCVATTYEEHAAILTQIMARQTDEACRLMALHIEGSHAEVNQITLHSMHRARTQAGAQRASSVPLRVRVGAAKS